MRKTLFSKLILFTLITCFALCCAMGLFACGSKKEAKSLGNVDNVLYATYDGKTAFVSGEFAAYGTVTIKNTVKDKPVTKIGEEAFCRNTKITEVIIEEGITEIGESAFYDCSALEKVVLPESLIEIDDNAFCGCENLSEITFPSKLQVIGSGAFGRCGKLESVTIPENVNTLGGFVFDECYNIKTFTVEGDVTMNGGEPSWKIESATIPASLASWMRGAKETVKTVVITCGTEIAGYAFEGCAVLESVEIADTVTNIGKYAFKGCDNLTSVVFKNTADYWKWIKDSTDIVGTPLNVEDAAKNAKNLSGQYCDYEWIRG